MKSAFRPERPLAALLFATALWALDAPPAHADPPATRSELLSPAAGANAPEADAKLGYRKCWAVIVGINYDFGNLRDVGVAKLANAERDAEALKRTLLENFEGYSEETVILLTGEEASKREIRTRLEYVRRHAEDRDSVLFFFAGHGGTEDLGVGGYKRVLLLPADLRAHEAVEGIPEADYLSWDELAADVLGERNAARHRLVILDSCYSGAIFESGRATPRNVSSLNATQFALSVSFALASAGAKQRASDGKDANGHSPFANALLEALKPGGIRLSTFGARSLETAVSGRLDERGEAQQPLGARLTESDGEFYFFRRADAPPAPADGAGGPADPALAGLPGLRGGWWFEETPWLTPGMRLDPAFAALVPAEPARPASVVAETEPPPSGTRTTAYLTAPAPYTDADALAVTGRVQKGAQTYVRDRSRLTAKRLYRQLTSFPWDDFDEADRDRLIEAVDAADDPHLAAVVRHRLGEADAGEAYLRALERYEAVRPPDEVDQTAESVAALALCRADYSRWLEEVADRPREAYGEADWALQDLPDGLPLLRIELLCRKAAADRTLSRWAAAEAALTEARGVADDLPDGHPLQAHVRERSAWLLMDQWRLSEAAEWFAEARDLRTAAEAADPAAKLLRLHDMHGLAMADRFRGERAQAREGYAKILQELAGVRPQSPQERELLADRLQNTQERLADLLLFTEPSNAPSAFGYLELGRQSANSIPAAARDACIGRLACKAVMAYAEAGDARGARDRLEEADAVLTQPTEEIEFYRTIAAAAVCLTENGCGPDGAGGAGVEQLRALVERLDARRRDARDGRMLAGKDLEPLLWVGRRLIRAQLAAAADPDAAATDRAAAAENAAADAERLVTLIPLSYWNPESVKFLRPFLDQVLAAQLREDDPIKLAAMIPRLQRAKTGEAAVGFAADGPAVFFLLYENDGAALCRSKTQTWTLHRLPAGRAALLGGQPFSVGDELLRQMTADGGGVAYWQDRVLPPTSRPVLPDGWTYDFDVSAAAD